MGLTWSAAKAKGLRYYFGAPCVHGHRRRYTCNRKCVTCNYMRDKRRRAHIVRRVFPGIEAARAGCLTYQGRPCAHGHTERYTNGRHCVACVRAKWARQAA